MLFFTKTYFCNNIFDMDQIRTTMFKKKKKPLLTVQFQFRNKAWSSRCPGKEIPGFSS